MSLDQDRYETLLIDKRENGVAVVSLNRPDRLNAVNGRLHHELSTFTRDAERDRAVKVVVLAGEGRAFCAGGDFSDDSGAGDLSLEEARQIVDHLLELQKPIISAVQGYAMGLGATVALLCDVVVAGKSAVFADTHVKLGIGAGDGGQVIWPLLMGVNRAKWFLMTGERITGEALLDMGLVSFLVEDDQIMKKALECADQLEARAQLHRPLAGEPLAAARPRA
jgi:enoyl-CoA hydratase/carnithine racemase